MIYPIKMNNEDDVVRVSNEAAKSGLDLSVSCGSAMIDPRSLLGLYNFVGKDAYLVAEDDVNPRYFQKLVERMRVSA